MCAPIKLNFPYCQRKPLFDTLSNVNQSDVWKFSGNSYLPRSTFPNMNDFSAEYMKDLVITQRKTHSEVSLLLKESSRSVKRFCFENWINLHNRLSNDELEQCTRDVVARVSISLLDLRACCSLFSSFFYLHFLVCIAVFRVQNNFSAFSVNL